MDQTTAKRLFEEGAVFIFLNVPEGTEFGIDMKSWTTGEKFRGVKMIPKGLHYIFYDSVSNTGDTAPRIGFFHYFRKGEVLVKKWDPQLEKISPENVDEEEVVRFKENIKTLDGFLGPYPFDIHEKWLNLTSSITDDLVTKLVPLDGQIYSALELEPCTDANRPKGIPKKDTDAQPSSSSSKNPKKSRLSGDSDSIFLPDLKPIPGTELRFTCFPEKSYPEGSSPAEITRHCLDSTYIFNSLIASYKNPTDLIGELQFSYICFLVGHSLEAFEQWKQLFALFCSCELAITRYRKLYNLFISSIELHIKEIPEEFLADIVSNNNFVYVKLRDLFRSIQESNIDGELKMKVERLKHSLTDTYSWDFMDLNVEEDDEAPVIVEC